MDSDAGSMICALIFVVLLLIDFTMTSFAAALGCASDTELSEAFDEAGKPAETVLQMKNHTGSLMHTIWLLNTVLYIGAGSCLHLFYGRSSDMGRTGCIDASVLSRGKFFAGDDRTEVAGQDSAQVFFVCAACHRGIVSIYICDDCPFQYLCPSAWNRPSVAGTGGDGG